MTDFFFVEGPLAYTNQALMGKGFRDNPAGGLGAVEGAREALGGAPEWEWGRSRGRCGVWRSGWR